MKFKKICIYLLVTVFLLLMNVVQLKAQNDGPGVPTACDGDPDVECPIDAPVILLAAAMLFLSVKKLGTARKQLEITG